MKNKRFNNNTGRDYHLFSLGCPHNDWMMDRLIEAIGTSFKGSVRDAIHILEVGCGPGFSTKRLLKLDGRLKVTAVDNEKVMIRQARKNLKRFVEEKRVRLVFKDGLEFLKGQKSGSFDLFVSEFTLHNFQDDYREEVLREIFRILKQGGSFFNLDKYAHDDEKRHQKALSWQLRKFKEVYPNIGRDDLAEEWTKHYLEDEKPRIIMRESESKKLMRIIGFKRVRIIARKRMEAIMVAEKPC